ncbi:MAG: diphosphate--fructose-6-phosphate 1-phosphotransferase [Chloroflexi bacterium]|nr:diphosphate--fructose-6-phosphate 1-phosphotransferase [Chloroflexota bacterium]MDA1227437.1 diphosphate--fructose-6-phosphate 1-phosphotransferase [Chloroflexota bacterium]
MAQVTGNNALIMQSGGCTPVINRSLYGVVQEAFSSNAFDQIHGALYGMEGILDEKLADLRAVDAAEWERIANTPAAALGSTRRKMRPEDVPVIIDVLKRNGIGYWFIIGGNDSAETGHMVGEASKEAGYPLTVINVPKTIDNDLVMMDHSPGFGSAARFIALATMGAGRDAEAMGLAAPVTIIEVMGRDAGWLAASAAAAKREERDAPHIIAVPEVPMDETRFLDRIETAYSKYGFAVAVMAENTRGPDGIIGGDSEPWYVDDFGHPYYDGPSRYLAGLVSKRLKVRARYEKPGTIQRSMMACVSESDSAEAEEVGREAVRQAVAGNRDVIITLERTKGDAYSCTTGTAPLAEVGGKVKTMPAEYLDPANDFVTEAFLEYLRPLLGSPLPAYGRVR